MINGVKIFFQWVIALAILGAISWGLYLAALRGADIYNRLDITLSHDTTAIIATTLSALMMLLLSKRRGLRIISKNRTLKQKSRAYEELIEKLSASVVHTEEGVQISGENIENAIGSLSGKMIALASRDVIAALHELTYSLGEKNETTTEVSSLFENLFHAIRKDLGHSGFPADGEKLLSLFLLGARTDSQPLP
ncbi:MAG: hypothetical protein OEY64_00285 [Nitrospinota bacterium]|nr:hypothetical protein [Nitrospinota bacterium]